jgi:succinate dehydrogenase hydrophobic anchor subunit
MAVNNIFAFLGALVIMAGIFFCVSAIVMALYNYTVPRLISSANKEYSMDRDFKKINFWTACTLVLLSSALFGGSNIIVNDRNKIEN